MKLRTATPQDAQAIAEVWNPIIRASPMTFTAVEKTPGDLARDIAQKQDAGLPYLVAEDSGTVLGFAFYAPFRASTGYNRTMEHTIYLAPEARGQGVGQALIAALETHGRTHGIHSLIAAITGVNSTAQAFHRAVGFAEVGRIPEAGHKFDTWFDLVLMQKRL